MVSIRIRKRINYRIYKEREMRGKTKIILTLIFLLFYFFLIFFFFLKDEKSKEGYAVPVSIPSRVDGDAMGLLSSCLPTYLQARLPEPSLDASFLQ